MASKGFLGGVADGDLVCPVLRLIFRAPQAPKQPGHLDSGHRGKGTVRFASRLVPQCWVLGRQTGYSLCARYASRGFACVGGNDDVWSKPVTAW